MSSAPKTYALLARNRVMLYKKRHGRFATAAFRGIAILHETLRSVHGGAQHRAALRALLSSRSDLVLQPDDAAARSGAV